MSDAPSLSGIHHCHIQVNDLDQDLVFYQQVMGFDVVPELAFWYHEQKDGPLMLADKTRRIHLALFEGAKRSNGIAFNATADEFLAWQAHLAQCDVSAKLFDHHASFSLYFKDLSGNMHEVTSYEYEQLAAKLSC